MDIHPMLVHFPIALLSMYAVFEIIPVSRWYTKLPWTAILTVLAVCGEVGAIAAALAGENAENGITDQVTREIVETHSAFAYASVYIFGILAASRLIKWIRTEHAGLFSDRYSEAITSVDSVIDFILSGPIRSILALAGLATITVAGALGAAMVHGPNIDPIVKSIYGFFF